MKVKIKAALITTLMFIVLFTVAYLFTLIPNIVIAILIILLCGLSVVAAIFIVYRNVLGMISK